MAFGTDVKNFLFGSPAKTTREPLINPQQQQFQSNILNQAQGLLGQVGKPTDIQPFLQQARERLATDTLPSIYERYAAMPGGRTSGAFRNALNNAAVGLESNLAGLQSQTQLADQNRLQSLLGNLLGPSLAQTDLVRREEGTSGLFGSLAPLLGFGLGTAVGGPLGGFLGGGLGSLGQKALQPQSQEVSHLQPQGGQQGSTLNNLYGLIQLLNTLRGGG